MSYHCLHGMCKSNYFRVHIAVRVSISTVKYLNSDCVESPMTTLSFFYMGMACHRYWTIHTYPSWYTVKRPRSQKNMILFFQKDGWRCWWTDFVPEAIHNPVAIKLLVSGLFLHRWQILYLYLICSVLVICHFKVEECKSHVLIRTLSYFSKWKR